MFDALIFAFTIFAAGSDLTFQAINQAQEFLEQALVTPKISTHLTFKNYLLQENYQRCIELIHQDQVLPTKEHFNIATQLAADQSNVIVQKDAQTCARFIYHNLVERGIIIPQKPNTRVIEDIVAELVQDGQGIQRQLRQAICANDIQNMQIYLNQGALPDLSSNCVRPAEIAITHGHLEALTLLYRNGVQPREEDLELATARVILLESNYSELMRDLIFTHTTDPEMHSGVDQDAAYADVIAQHRRVRIFIVNELFRARMEQQSR